MPRQVPAYQPFFAEAMGSVAKGFQSREQQGIDKHKNKLASSAWMGDPMAMQELTAMDPELAMQVEDQAIQRKTKTQQNTMAKDSAFATDMERVIDQIGAFPDFASAQRYGQQMTNIMAEKYPERWQQSGIPTEFNEAAFNEISTIAAGTGKKGLTTVGSPYQVEHPKTGEPATAILRDDGKGNVYEELMEGPNGSSLTRLSQYDVDLKRQLAQAQATGAEEGQSAEQRAQTAIDAGTAAATTIPNLNRSLALLDQLDEQGIGTSGFKEDLNALMQYVGWEGEETADLSELQQLLAVQMFDTLANFTGSISEGELKTAKALSTGLGKNTESNKRILRAMQQRLARAIDLAKKAATERNDVVALEMLEIFDPYAASPYDRASALPPAAATSTPPAPAAAIEQLKANPDQIDAFVDAFGYRPKGF